MTSRVSDDFKTDRRVNLLVLFICVGVSSL